MSDDEAIVNVDELDWRRQNPGGDFDADVKDVSEETSLRKIGLRLYRLKPGKTAWPFHAHLANEEVIYVQDGEGTLRYADTEYTVSTGDCLAFPADPDCPHQLVNTSDRDLRYLCVSTMVEPDAIRYPDSEKIGVFAGEPPGGSSEDRDFEGIYSTQAEQGYWEGEISEED